MGKEKEAEGQLTLEELFPDLWYGKMSREPSPPQAGEDFRAVLEETCRVADCRVSVPGPPAGCWKSAGAILGSEFSIAWRVLDAQYWGVPQRRKRIFLVADFGGMSAPEILFKWESLPGNPAEGGGTGTETSAGSAGSAGGPSGMGITILCLNDQGGQVMECSENITGTLRARMSGHPPLVAQPTFCIAGTSIDRQPQNGGNGLGCLADVCYTLNTADRHAVCSYQKVGLGENAWLGQNLIRRLTPLECERLQGFPDGWTALPGASDSARYKALGNSVAVPCVVFVLRGIAHTI